MIAASSTIPVPAFAIGIVAVWALLWLLMTGVDSIKMSSLRPPNPYRDQLPPPPPEPMPAYDLDRIPPRRHIIAAGRRLAELEHGQSRELEPYR